MHHAPTIYGALEASVPVIVQTVVAAVLITLLVAWRVGASIGPDALVPDARFSLRNVVEVLFEGICSLAHDAIGHDWKKYMPLLGTLGLFILIANLMGTVPGLGGPTSYVETNLSWAILSVVTSEVAAMRVNGIAGWAKHMAPGPWWLAPLMFPVELFSHLVRFVSLTIRLTANMFADHTLVAIFVGGFGATVAILFPWIVLALSVFVCFVQAFIFTFLTMLYIGLGTEESH
ncbi:MAG: F0F1 ATP synthase subunit A [Myxococcota bacterium]